MINYLIRLASIIITSSFIITIYLIHYVFIQQQIKIDVIPDLSDKQIIIYCKYEGQSPQSIRDQITYKLTSSLLALPKVKYVREYTMNNFSLVYVIIEDNADLYWVRSRVSERLSSLDFPENAQISLGPDATGVGWIFQYVITSNKLNLSQLWDLQEFYIKYRLLSVDGVAEVATVGGFEKEYRIFIDPLKLAQYNIQLDKIIQTIQENNLQGGGKYIEIYQKQTLIQTQGYFKNPKDIINLPIQENIRLKDIAYLAQTPSLRMGTTDYNGTGNTIGGIVIVRQNADTYKTIQKIKKEIARIKIPEDTKIIPVYDRSFIIEETIKGLIKDISKELWLTIIVVALFIFDLKLALVICYYMVLSVLLTIFIFDSLGFSSNIMSLGGLILSIGAMIDAGIVIVENYHRKMENYQKLLSCKIMKISFIKNLDNVSTLFLINTYREVGFPIFIALLIVGLSFTPFMFLSGQIGKLFSPLVITKTLAMLIGAILAILIVIPSLSLLKTWKVLEEYKNPLNCLIEKTYTLIFKLVMKIKIIIIILPIFISYFFFQILFSLKTEFLPNLREFVLMYMPITTPGITIDEAQRLLTYQNKIIMTIPEVYSVFGKAGRADTATDPAPLSMIETIITLKHPSQWRKEIDYEKLIQEIDQKLQIPGVVNGWTQPIKGRIDMITTGIRTPLGIKVSSDNIEKLSQITISIEKKLKESNLFSYVFAERNNTQPYLIINYNREKLSLRNLSIKNVQDYIDYLFNNKPISTYIDGIKRYKISLGIFEYQKYNLENLPLYIGNQLLKLSDIAEIKYQYSLSEIKTENGLYVSYIYIIPQKGIDINLAIKETDKILTQLLPPNFSYEYSGEFKRWQEIKQKLIIIIPLVVTIILTLVYLIFNNLKDVLIVFYLLPSSLIGCLLSLKYYNYGLSVASIAGIISTIGIAAEMLIIMVIYIKNSLKSKGSIEEKIFNGAVKRVRPKIMTALTICISLMPILYSTEIGSEIMKIIVTPMIGGTITSFICALIFIPPIYHVTNSKLNKKKNTKGKLVN